DQSSFYRVYDGADPGSVDTDKFVLISDVSLADIDAALTPYWHRTAEEVWTVGSPDKAARAIVHWHEGGRMTPPLIVPTSDGRPVSASVKCVIVKGALRLTVGGMLTIIVNWIKFHSTL